MPVLLYRSAIEKGIGVEAVSTFVESFCWVGGGKPADNMKQSQKHENAEIRKTWRQLNIYQVRIYSCSNI